MWHCRSKGGRIIFEVALDYSEEKQGYRDMLRLWVSWLKFHPWPQIACNSTCLEGSETLQMRCIRRDGAALAAAQGLKQLRGLSWCCGLSR